MLRNVRQIIQDGIGEPVNGCLSKKFGSNLLTLKKGQARVFPNKLVDFLTLSKLMLGNVILDVMTILEKQKLTTMFVSDF